MNRITSHKVAMGLLVFCLLALVIGIFNAARLKQGSLLSTGAELALIDLSGMIVMDNSNENGLFNNESNAVLTRKSLDEAAEDDSIKGVLLRINSPGGTVGMSQELNAAVQRVSKKKPVVVSMGDLTASGGYYTACAADKILANPGTLTASIGVIISTMDFSDLMTDKLGIKAVTIKSGKFKDLLSPYRKARPEELALIQELIDDSYQDFLNTVIQGRTRFMTNEAEKKARTAKIKAVADGRIVTGRQALAAGLVDEIGDLERAHTVLDILAKERFHLKGKERLKLEPMGQDFSLLELFGISMASRQDSANPAVQVAKMVPLSMRYPNQPLWIME